MGDPGLDPGKVLQIVQTLLYGLAYLLGGTVLLGLSAYVVFLCKEVFSPQPSRARRAKVPPAVASVPATEGKLDMAPAETLIPAGAEPVCQEAMGVPALRHEAQTRRTIGPLTLGSESTGPCEASSTS